MSDQYKYINLPLDRVGAKDLILELFYGKTVTREEIVDSVFQTHINRGGLPPNDSIDVARDVIKPVLTQLKDLGVAENPALSYWRVPNENDTNRYIYRGIPLMGNIAKDLILDLYSGENFKRSDIIEPIINTHKERGGLPPNTDNVLTSIIKPACKRLEKEGVIYKTPVHGIWGFYTDEDINKLDDDEDDEDDEDENLTLKPDKVIGSGNGCVYVYYYPIFRKSAEYDNKSVWECKIGRSNDPISRIFNQIKTALPEYPVIGLIIKTEMPDKLERTIHNILSIRNARKLDAPGSEWYMTNPSEIEDIYSYVYQKAV